MKRPAPRKHLRLLVVGGQPEEMGRLEALVATIDFRKSLIREIAFDWTASLDEAMKKVSERQVEVLLVCADSKGGSPLATVERAVKQADSIPVLVLADSGMSEVAFKALQMGAQDFLSRRSLTGESLLRSVLFAIQRHQSMRQAKEAGRLASDETERRNQVLANVTHELRTPMNAVIGMTSLLLTTNLTEEQFEYVNTIRVSGEALLDLVNDILDFSKLEAGMINLEPQEFDLLRLVTEALEMFGEASGASGVELVSRWPADLPRHVYGDPTRVRQVLCNLVGNAIKFTPKGEVVLSVEVAARSAESWTLRFSVLDTGPGISPEGQARLFQRFSRADLEKGTRVAGTGLGLAISKRLVELMEGQIGVESEVGKGSRFWFTLPVPPPSGLPVLAEADDLKGKKALVVDDNESQGMALKDALERFGMKVEYRSEPLAGYADLRTAAERRAPFDLAIFDMQMPRMTGLDLGQAVHSDRDLSWVKLVLSYAHSRRMRGLIDRAKRAGFSYTLPKPFDYDRLRNGLLHAMGSAEAKDWGPAFVPRRRWNDKDDQRRGFILVVEDNPVNQRVARWMLEKGGHRVEVVGRGEEGVLAATQKEYSLVLMDCQLPDFDGLEAARRVRDAEAKTGKRVPIIGVSADPRPETRADCLDAGMDDFLAKPLRLDELQSVLDKWLTPERAAARTKAEVAPQLAALDKEIMSAFRAVIEDGAGDFLKELIEVFLDQVPPLMKQMREALEKNDATSVRRAAHRMRGSCITIGAVTLVDPCKRLEELGAKGDLGAAGTVLSQLEKEFDRVRRSLELEIRMAA